LISDHRQYRILAKPFYWEKNHFFVLPPGMNSNSYADSLCQIIDLSHRDKHLASESVLGVNSKPDYPLGHESLPVFADNFNDSLVCCVNRPYPSFGSHPTVHPLLYASLAPSSRGARDGRMKSWAEVLMSSEQTQVQKSDPSPQSFLPERSLHSTEYFEISLHTLCFTHTVAVHLLTANSRAG
jgi:hypothetical protein